MDADGNTIVGNTNYVDSSGHPVVFLLNVTNTQAGGRGTVSIQGPMRITAPGQAAIIAHYDGQWLDHASVSIMSTSAAVTSLSSATFTTLPHVFEYSAAGQPLGLVGGPDGNLSSRPRELHPQPLTERCVNLSIHTALIKQTNLLSHFPSAQTNSAVA